MTALRTLAETLAGLAVHDEGLREAARQRIFDALGALAVGRATDEGRVLARLSDTARAALVRLAVGATRATEIDDIHLPSCVTAGSVVVPAAAVLAARAGPCVDEDFLAALAQMPQASGIALGFDRLVMLASGAERVDDVIWTPVVESE